MRRTNSFSQAEFGERPRKAPDTVLNTRDREELLARCEQLQKALEESESRYYDLAESLPQTIYEIDLDGNLKYSNAYGLKSMGYSVEDIKNGLNVCEIIVPQDRQRVRANISRILAGEKILGQEYDALRKDGTTIPVMIFSRPIKRGDLTVGLRGIIVDISERKRYEEALRLSEEKYRTLFDQKLDGVVVLDQDLKILLANSAAAEIFGFEAAEEINGLGFLDFVAEEEEDGFRFLMKSIFEYDLRQINEVRCIKKTGAQIWIALICHTIAYQGKLAGLVSFRDITVEKQAEEKLRKSRVEIQNLYAHSHMVREEERNLIAHEIHDELGQVLTALQIDLYWLQKRLGKDSSEVQEKVRSMSGLISDSISSVQRICSKLSPPILDELGIAAALEWQVSEFEKHFGISAEFRSSVEELDITRECSIAIFRVVQEALTNVARHAQANKVNVSLSKKNGNLIVTIVDDGKGISLNQIHSSYSYGLLGMKERALAFGGEFNIKRGRRGGTAVIFSVPVTRSGAGSVEENTGR